LSELGLNLPADFGWPGDAPPDLGTLLPWYGPGILQRMLGFFQGDPISDQTLAVPAAATALNVPALANSAMLTVEAASVRMRLGNLDATAALGHLLGSGTIINLTGNPTLRAVSLFQAAVGAIVTVTYFS
jgi:hypothetical protein